TQVVVLTGQAGASQGGRVAAEAVVQDGGDVPRHTQDPPLAPAPGVLDGRIDQLHRRGLLALPGGEEKRGVPHGRVAGCRRDGIALLDERRGGGEFSGIHVNAGEVDQQHGQGGERAGFAGQADGAGGELAPPRVVPHL